jgi:hypothetical protein
MALLPLTFSIEETQIPMGAIQSEKPEVLNLGEVQLVKSSWDDIALGKEYVCISARYVIFNEGTNGDTTNTSTYTYNSPRPGDLCTAIIDGETYTAFVADDGRLYVGEYRFAFVWSNALAMYTCIINSTNRILGQHSVELRYRPVTKMNPAYLPEIVVTDEKLDSRLQEIVGTGGNANATIDGETLVFVENSSVTIENETLVL